MAAWCLPIPKLIQTMSTRTAVLVTLEQPWPILLTAPWKPQHSSSPPEQHPDMDTSITQCSEECPLLSTGNKQPSNRYFHYPWGDASRTQHDTRMPQSLCIGMDHHCLHDGGNTIVPVGSIVLPVITSEARLAQGLLASATICQMLSSFPCSLMCHSISPTPSPGKGCGSSRRGNVVEKRMVG